MSRRVFGRLVRAARRESGPRAPSIAEAEELRRFLNASTLFATAPGETVLAVTHFVELPRDLTLIENKALAQFDDRADDAFDGWPEPLQKRFVGYEGVMAPGSQPTNRAVFRRAVVRTRLPLEAADRTFADLVRPFLSKREAKLRDRTLRAFSKRGFIEPVTVAAVTRWIATSNWPLVRAEQEDLLRNELDASLAFLNGFLVWLGITRGDAQIQPVARGELPALCPVLLSAAPTFDVLRGATFIYPIHGDQPSLPIPDASDDNAAESATLLTTLQNRGELKLGLFYELMHKALYGVNTYRLSDAIISLGTGIEAMLAVVLAEGHAALTGVPAGPDELGRGLKNRVRDHLGRVSGVRSDPDDTTTAIGRWWAGGYALRNRVVHDGHKPSPIEVESAFADGEALIAALRSGLRQQTQTRDLGEQLDWQLRSGPPPNSS